MKKRMSEMTSRRQESLRACALVVVSVRPGSASPLDVGRLLRSRKTERFLVELEQHDAKFPVKSVLGNLHSNGTVSVFCQPEQLF